MTKKTWEPSEERKEEIRETLNRALPFSLEIYGIKEMAIDSEIPLKEAKWAAEHIYFKACISS